MTVWYKPDSSWKTAKVNYQANGKWSGGAQQMEASCGGWYRYDPGHRRRAGAHGVHGRRFRLGQQRRAGARTTG